MIPLDKQIKKLLTVYPTFSSESMENGYLITGKYTLDKEYNSVPLWAEYQIKMMVPNEFPFKLPLLKETTNALPSNFEHHLAGNYICLGTECELLDYLEMNPDVTCFVDEIVSSYFYSATYFNKYGNVPYGERSHGLPGIIEYYKERLGVDNEQQLFSLLYIVAFDKYRGHDACPCGSGKLLRSCHGSRLLKDLTTNRKQSAQNDALQILHYIYNKRKNKANK